MPIGFGSVKVIDDLIKSSLCAMVEKSDWSELRRGCNVKMRRQNFHYKEHKNGVLIREGCRVIERILSFLK